MPQQGLAYFPGIQQILAASVTFNQGITPSLITLTIAPQFGLEDFGNGIGTFTFAEGGRQIQLRNCKIDRFAFDQDGRGLRRWTLYVFDRRWRWVSKTGGGQISGYYNTRRNDGEIIEETKLNAKKLVKLCLDAMGETRIDISAVPTDQYPVAAWDYHHAPEALAQLCESMGYRVSLSPVDDTVSVFKVGEGSELPIDDTVLENTQTLDLPESADTLIAVAAKNRYQPNLTLEMVAPDQDGKIVLAKDVSYNPNKGKDIAALIYDLPNFQNIIKNDDLRNKAKATFGKWYRIKNGQELPGEKENHIGRSRLLPVEDEQIAQGLRDDVPYNLPAIVYGIFYAESSDMKNNVDKIDHKTAADDKQLCQISFSIDQEEGIVKFSQPVYQQKPIDPKDPTKGFMPSPAELYLRTAVGLRDAQTRAWKHYEVKRKLNSQGGSQPRYMMISEISYNQRPSDTTSSSKPIDNKSDVEEVLNFYLDAAEQEYQIDTPQTVTYAGLRPIDLDGAVRQLTIVLDESGHMRTRVSRNREETDVEISYDNRRMTEKLIASLRDEQRRKDATKADQDKQGPKS